MVNQFQMDFNTNVVNIIKRDSSGSPVLDENKLSQLLIDTQACNIPVAFYSICGSSRLGKSFLWNQFVRYLKDSNLFVQNQQSEEYLEKFFEWKAGDDRHTEGIFVNRQPFILSSLHYDKVALFLMDTQGMFDNIESGGNSGMVVALSFLISSLQVYNVNTKIEANHLQYVYKFSRVCKSATKSNLGLKPLQSLMFLIRDWRRKKTYGLGLGGGTQYVQSLMEIKDSQAEDQRHVREAINENFENICGFLLPEPGENIAYMTPEDDNCRINDVDPSFYEFIEKLFKQLTTKDTIILKTIDGSVVNGSVLYDYIVKNAPLLDSYNQVSEHFRTFVDFDYRSDMKKVVKECILDYVGQICNEFKSHDNQNEYNRSWLDAKHGRFKKSALRKYDKSKKPGDQEMHDEWRATLGGYIDENYRIFQECVRSENIFSKILEEYKDVLYSGARDNTGRFYRIFTPRDALIQRSNIAYGRALEKINKEIDRVIAEQCCMLMDERIKMLLKQELVRVTSVAIGIAISAGSLALYWFDLISPFTALASIGLVLGNHYFFVRKLIKSYLTEPDRDDFSCIKTDAVVVLSYGTVRFRVEYPM